MIDNEQKLWDHVNRFQTMGRLGPEGKAGRVHIGPEPRSRLHPEGETWTIPLGPDDLEVLELRTPGPEGTFQRLEDYDEAAAAAQIERWEARQNYRDGVAIFNRAREKLLRDHRALHPEDRAVAGGLQILTEQRMPEWGP